jgi:hypothetical protein
MYKNRCTGCFWSGIRDKFTEALVRFCAFSSTNKAITLQKNILNLNPHVVLLGRLLYIGIQTFIEISK